MGYYDFQTLNWLILQISFSYELSNSIDRPGSFFDLQVSLPYIIGSNLSSYSTLYLNEVVSVNSPGDYTLKIIFQNGSLVPIQLFKTSFILSGREYHVNLSRQINFESIPVKIEVETTVPIFQISVVIDLY